MAIVLNCHRGEIELIGLSSHFDVCRLGIESVPDQLGDGLDRAPDSELVGKILLHVQDYDFIFLRGHTSSNDRLPVRSLVSDRDTESLMDEPEVGHIQYSEKKEKPAAGCKGRGLQFQSKWFIKM